MSTSRERMRAGKVSASIRAEMDDFELENWAGLSADERERVYRDALTDHRIAHANENGFISNKLGQGVARGKGGVLVSAIRNAWLASDTHRAQEQARRAEWDSRDLECNECGKSVHHDKMVTCGSLQMCNECVWEKHPASAEMLGLPRS